MNNEKASTPSWQVYQRCVGAFVQQAFDSMDITVQPNVWLYGKISGVKRQVDVLVDGRYSDSGEVSKRIIVDAKKRTSKIDINDVESFEGMMRDCNATNGVLISTGGFTSGAIQRANEIIHLKVLSFEDAQEYDWIYKPCLSKDCRNGFVLWDSHMLLPVSGYAWLICQTGICDVCHHFHVWCQDCGTRFHVEDEQGCICYCGHEWYSVIQADDEDNDSINWLILISEDEVPKPIVVNRKAIR
ncbi:MAG: restriction endonuclease [Chloroflexota bacterium]